VLQRGPNGLIHRIRRFCLLSPDRNNIATDAIAPIGFATFCPAIVGAEP
jgi:hypothetical protein